MAGPARRSARQRKVNPKYANDGWDKETLRKLRASSESSGSSPTAKSAPKTPDQGHDISSDGEEDVSISSAAPSPPSDIDSPSEEDDDGSPTSNDDGPGRRKQRDRSRPHLSSSNATSAHSRGIAAGQSHGSKRAAYPLTFGPGVEDLRDILSARDIWLKGCDVTIPSRRSISATIEHSRLSYASGALPERTHHIPLHSRSTSVTAPAETIKRNQVLTVLDDEDLLKDYLSRATTSHSIVLGPWGKQTKSNLDHLNPSDFGRAWSVDAATEIDQDRPSQNSPSAAPHHQGWLINVGEKVQCLAWAPVSGHIQYLAVVTRCTPSQRHSVSWEVSDRPAFHPSPSYPSSIQIWAFQTDSTQTSHVRTLSFKTQPRLAMVIATDWGDIRRLEWCRSIDPGATVNTIDHPHMGNNLLGLISTDGCARVLALQLPEGPSSGPPVSLKAAQAGFTICPSPGTIFTTLTFLDSENVVVGASDGSVQLFDLAAQINHGQAPCSYMKIQVHNTYIIALCPASPSPFSTIIASTSASGELVLTDLRSPDQDRISLPRACFPHRDLLFSPFTRSFITGLDRAGNTHMETHSATFIVCHHLRQFSTGVRIARLPSLSGAATALANSPWHPCILVGNARGQILATNYVRKVLSYRRGVPGRAAHAYLQKICEYDWRPLNEQGESKEARLQRQEADLYHGQGVRPGVSRFHEGFKPEKVEVASAPLNAKTQQPKDSGIAEPIFEEEQAVTSIDWCPNAFCAGLAAMGWGSGIVRVQDLAHDLI